MQYLLIISLLANLAGVLVFIKVIHGRGGLKYLKAYFQKDPDSTLERCEKTRDHLLSVLPIPEVPPIVFLGDSQTARCEWHEMFHHRVPILNRGISGDTSAGVLKRLPSISKLQPSAVFLMIGTNDAQLIGYSPAQTLDAIRTIINEISQKSPATDIYLESILPSRTPKFNRWSKEVNDQLRQLANGRKITFIDLRPAFFDEDQLLSNSYTDDGLHMNAAGYFLWKQHLDPIMESLAARPAAMSARA